MFVYIYFLLLSPVSSPFLLSPLLSPLRLTSLCFSPPSLLSSPLSSLLSPHCLLSAYYLFYFFLSLFLWACKYNILIRNTDRSDAWSPGLHPSRTQRERERERERERAFISISSFFSFLLFSTSHPPPHPPSPPPSLPHTHTHTRTRTRTHTPRHPRSLPTTWVSDLSSRCRITVYRKAIKQHIGWMRSALILASAFVSGVWCESFSFLSATLRLWRS